MMGGLGHEMLQNVDTDSDGALSQDEINSAVNSRFSQFDADKNGSLSLPEFEALWADITKPIAVRAFQFLDPNGDAGIAKAELDDRFGNLVSSFDRNDDGKLSRDDRGGRQGHRGWGHGWRGEGPQENESDNQ
jgi:Ca2+-binding EF-hand superfamily protein